MKTFTVTGVRSFFDAMEKLQAPDGTNALQAFLDECDRRGLVLTASEELYELGRDHYDRVPKAKAAGPDCPACPEPSR